MSRTDAQFKLRLPPELKTQIETSAQENGRSINAEIVEQLRAIYHVQDISKAASSEHSAPVLTPEERIFERLNMLKMHTNQIELIRQDVERYLTPSTDDAH